MGNQQREGESWNELLGKKKNNLAVSGLSCSMQDLSLRQTGFSVAAEHYRLSSCGGMGLLERHPQLSLATRGEDWASQGTSRAAFLPPLASIDGATVIL